MLTKPKYYSPKSQARYCFSTFIKLDKTKKNSSVHPASLMDLCQNFLYIQNKIMCFLPSYNKLIKSEK